MKALILSLLLQYLKFRVSVCTRGPFPRDRAAKALSWTPSDTKIYSFMGKLYWFQSMKISPDNWSQFCEWKETKTKNISFRSIAVQQFRLHLTQTTGKQAAAMPISMVTVCDNTMTKFKIIKAECSNIQHILHNQNFQKNIPQASSVEYSPPGHWVETTTTLVPTRPLYEARPTCPPPWNSVHLSCVLRSHTLRTQHRRSGFRASPEHLQTQTIRSNLVWD